MAAAAMPLEDLERWLQARIDRHPAATSLPMLDGYVAALNARLIPDMGAGRTLLTAFTRHAGTFHKGLSTGKGWGTFVKFCRSERSFAELVNRPAARLALSVISRLLPG